MTYNEAVTYVHKDSNNKVKLSTGRYGLYMKADLEDGGEIYIDTLFNTSYKKPANITNFSEDRDDWEVYNEDVENSRILTIEEKFKLTNHLKEYYKENNIYKEVKYLYLYNLQNDKVLVNINFEDNDITTASIKIEKPYLTYNKMKQYKHYKPEELGLFW